jgi:hypothetical protein
MSINTNDLLLRQQQNIEQINALLEQSMDTILCGPECQRLKLEQELEQKYIDAQMNLETAPVILEDTKKNYYVFKEGETYYNEMLEKELTQKANELTKLLKQNFNKQISNVNILNKYYESDLINSDSGRELYKHYKKENEHLEKIIKEEYGDILTNNRKTYYSVEGLLRLKLWHKFFWYIYYILYIILIISFLLVDSQLSLIKKIVISIILLVYPYIIHPIVKWFYNIIIMLYNKLPKSVYNNI